MDSATRERRVDPETLEALAALADRADAELDWPAASWEQIHAAGVPSWSVPAEFGGLALEGSARLRGYEQLAAACLTTTFILSQRDAAVRRILSHGQPEIKTALLPRLARDEIFLTVGLSQLTTSRQHQAPALSAEPRGDGYLLEGVIPWVTGAARADALLVGATLADGLQVLMLLPRDRAGVEVEAPMELCALRGSQTTQVRCHAVRIERADVLAGPSPRVARRGGGRPGNIVSGARAWPGPPSIICTTRRPRGRICCRSRNGSSRRVRGCDGGCTPWRPGRSIRRTPTTCGCRRTPWRCRRRRRR